MFSQFGPLEIVLVLVVLLVVFGPKRLPGLGKSLGTGMREFKDSITGDDKERDQAKEPAAPAALPSAQQQAAPEPAAAPAEPAVVDAVPEHRG